MIVLDFTRVFYHGTKDKYHGRATVTGSTPQPYGRSTDGRVYELTTPVGPLYNVARQSFKTLREVNNA